MVWNQYSLESMFLEQTQRLENIYIPFINKHFLILRNLAFHIAEMHITYLSLGCVFGNCIINIATGHFLDASHTEFKFV